MLDIHFLVKSKRASGLVKNGSVYVKYDNNLDRKVRVNLRTDIFIGTGEQPCSVGILFAA